MGFFPMHVHTQGLCLSNQHKESLSTLTCVPKLLSHKNKNGTCSSAVVTEFKTRTSDWYTGQIYELPEIIHLGKSGHFENFL